MNETTTATASATGAALPGPRIRWAGIVWGVVLGAAAALTLWVLLDGGRRRDFSDWFTHLSPATAALYGILVLGGIVLVTGLLGLVRGAQRRRSAAAANAADSEPAPLAPATAGDAADARTELA